MANENIFTGVNSIKFNQRFKNEGLFMSTNLWLVGQKKGKKEEAKEIKN